MGKLNRQAFEGLIEQNIEWLERVGPDCLERSHIVQCLLALVDHEYGPDTDALRKENADLRNKLQVSPDLAEAKRIIERASVVLKKVGEETEEGLFRRLSTNVQRALEHFLAVNADLRNKLRGAEHQCQANAEEIADLRNKLQVESMNREAAEGELREAFEKELKGDD